MLCNFDLQMLILSDKCYLKREDVFMAESYRIKSIDALRGIAIAIMIIGDNPGNGKRIYTQLRHPKWNGLTLADFAFPFFILTMCMIIPIVMEKNLASKKVLTIIFNVIKRSFIIIFLGLFLNGFPLFDLNSIRIPGVLQRLGIVYLSISLLYLLIRCRLKNESLIMIFMMIAAAVIIIGYYLLLKPSGFNIESNLASKVDVHLLNNHLYTKSFDPEGIISTIGAIASGLLGCIIGYIFTLKTESKYLNLLYNGALGIVCIISAYLFCKAVPFNKQLWSSSFILITAGYGALLAAVLYLICDICKKDSILTPFIYLGSNPIFIYLITELIRRSIWKIPVYDERLNLSLSLPTWITTKFITPWAGTLLDSFYFSLSYLIVWMAIAKKMYTNNKFIRI